MRRGYVAFSILTLVGLGLTGCGLFRFEQREPWRRQAEEACLSQRLVQASAYMSRTSEIDGPGICGITYPFRITAFAGGSVEVSRQATLACPIIPRVDGWLTEIVQPAATLYFGVPVVELKSGTYACRSRNNQRGARLSEHAFGNAMDVSAFRLADGREISVLKGWRGDPAEQDFLREVFVGACRHFTTVLGPGADRFHDDHLHIDLARHDPRGTRRICKPTIKFAPRLNDPVLALSHGRSETPRSWGAPPRPARQGWPPPPPAPAADEEEFEAGRASAAAPTRPHPVPGPGGGPIVLQPQFGLSQPIY